MAESGIGDGAGDLVRSQRVTPNKWLVTISVTFGTLMGAIDAAIVNVAIPQVRGALGASLEEIAWVTTAFLLATVLVMPFTAFLGRLYGQKRLYMTCLALFLAGSAMCGMANSLVWLVIGRIVQGLGAGPLLPLEQAILRQTFPPKEQGMAMAVFGMAVMIGPAIGPTLGGLIVDNVSWPWIFYVNLPVGAVALLMVARFVHDPEDVAAHNRAMAREQRKHTDWAGIGFLSVGLFTLLYVLEEGGRRDWFESRSIVLLSLVSLFALALFVARELTARVPAVDLTLLRDRSFLAATVLGAVMFAMLMSTTFLLPVFMQELLGFSALRAGIFLMPRAIVMFITTAIVGRIYNYVSPRALMFAGLCLFIVSAYFMSHYNVDTGPAEILTVLTLQGVGFGLIFVPLATVALVTIPRHKLPDATGLNAVVRQIGSSIGLAVFVMLIPRFVAQARAAVHANVIAGSTAAMERLDALAAGYQQAGLDATAAGHAAVAHLSGTLHQQAAVLAFDKLFLLSGICFVGMLPLLLLFRTGHAHGQD